MLGRYSNGSRAGLWLSQGVRCSCSHSDERHTRLYPNGAQANRNREYDSRDNKNHRSQDCRRTL